MEWSLDIKSVVLFKIASIVSFSAIGQNVKKHKMTDLSYMTGEWVGMSKSIKENETTIVPAYESIKYGLDSNIIIVDLKSETLILHTIISYSEKDSTYYYQPFSKTGTGKYKADFDGKKLVVRPHETVRYNFTLTEDGNFMEYGEKQIKGEWKKYFEDTFKRMD